MPYPSSQANDELVHATLLPARPSHASNVDDKDSGIVKEKTEDVSLPSFYTLIDNFPKLPPIPIDVRNLAYTVGKCLDRISPHCVVCYFMRTPKPIRVILTHPRGGEWEEFDSHNDDAFKCPWKCLDRHAYAQFSSDLTTSLRTSRSGCSWCLVCTDCAEPWDYSFLYHERCFSRGGLFMLAYLVWDHRLSRDRVFSFIHHSTGIRFPELNDKSGFGDWLGQCITPSRPTLNNIHVFVSAYHILRWNDQLPR